MTLRGMMGRDDLHIWGIYAPTKTAAYRKEWTGRAGKEMKKKKGLRIIAGDFNFVMDTKWDKIGGNKNKGTEGRKEQRKWEMELDVRDAWRNFNPDTVATTWASREAKKVRTRIDRVLIDERLIEKTTETTINKMIISDHDVITWTIETREKMKSPYDRITTEYRIRGLSERSTKDIRRRTRRWYDGIREVQEKV